MVEVHTPDAPVSVLAALVTIVGWIEVFIASLNVTVSVAVGTLASAWISDGESTRS